MPRLIAHDDALPYMDCVHQIKGNSITREVKLVALMHNSDLILLDVIDEKALERAKKYREAVKGWKNNK